MAEQRLPVVDGDDGLWGDILNQFLSKEHYDSGLDSPSNGGHKTITIRPGTNVAGTAPLKFTSGSLLTTPEVGAVEFNTDSLYVTQTTGTVRKKVAIYDDTSGAEGDLYYRDASGAFVRLAIGSTNNVLTVSAGRPAWVAPGSTNTTRSVSTISSPTTAGSVTGTDYIYFVSAAVTVTLPTAVSNTNQYTIKNTSTGTVTIATTSGQLIDGSTPITLIANQSVNIISDNTNWQII